MGSCRTVSLPNHTFTGQAKSSKRLTCIVHILSPEINEALTTGDKLMVNRVHLVKNISNILQNYSTYFFFFFLRRNKKHEENKKIFNWMFYFTYGSDRIACQIMNDHDHNNLMQWYRPTKLTYHFYLNIILFIGTV